MLIGRDGVLADPAAFQPADSTCKAADKCVGGEGVQRYLILDTVFSGSPHSYYGAFLIDHGRAGGPA